MNVTGGSQSDTLLLLSHSFNGGKHSEVARGAASTSFHILFMFDPMSELTGGAPMHDSGSAPVQQGGGNRSFAQDLHSVTIHARQRTFYIDLKQSGNGKFFKISEKSRGGQKTTIMFDSEDLDKFVEALQEMKTKL